MMIRYHFKIFYFLIGLLSISMTLSSCMMGSVAVSGAQAVYDRHNIQKKLDDNFTTMQAYRAIYLNNDQYEDTHLSISAFNDAILITGQIPQSEQKQEISGLILKLAGDRKIYNFSKIARPTSLFVRASDSWITSKIKLKLIATNDIDPTKIKVITENGTVFLMGIVPHADADIASEIAESTSGVQSVVKIFSYLEIVKA